MEDPFSTYAVVGGGGGVQMRTFAYLGEGGYMFVRTQEINLYSHKNEKPTE